MRARGGKEDPLYLKAQKEIAIYEQNLEEFKRQVSGPIRADVELSLRSNGSAGGVVAIDGRHEELARLRNALRSYEIAEENLRKAYSSQLKKFLTEFEQVSGENVNLTFMKDELTQAQKVLERITERLIALQTERAAPRG